jgi:DNA-binding HxlR family transcriptional regulator
LYSAHLQVSISIGQDREEIGMVVKEVPCAVEVTVKLIGNKWKVLIIELFEGTKRFGVLFKSKGLAGISQKMLTQQLRQMEKDGIVVRTVYPEVPSRVEYSLTDLGKSLKPILDHMDTWGSNYITEKGPGEGEKMMNREETVMFLDAYFAALAKGEIEKIPLAADVTLTGPMGGPLKGEPVVRALLIQISQTLQKIKLVVRRHVIDGEHACSMCDMELPSGEKVALLDYFHIVDGKIKWLQPFYDPRPMQDTWGWLEAENSA